MGRTSKPLIIEVHPSIIEWPEWAEFNAQGHTIITDPNTVDLKFGPACWFMTEDHKRYLKLAFDRARGVKYPKEAK